MNGCHAPDLSVIVITPDRYETVRKTMSYLRAQTARHRMEIVIVAPSVNELHLEQAEMKGFLQYQVIEVSGSKLSAAAKAAGVRQASAPLVAFIEDHAFPEPRWAEALIQAHQQPWAAVGPVVSNANPRRLVSWATFFTAYGRWAEPAVAGEIDDLPGQKGAYKREILRQYGPELEQMLEVPTVLHWDLRAKGYRLYWEPAAKIDHLHPSLLSSYLKEQFLASRLFAAARARHNRWSVLQRFIYMGGAPLIPLVRLWRILRDIKRCGQGRYLLPRLLPTLIAGLVVDGVGEMIGYALGAGEAAQKIFYFEFHRDRHLTEDDRQEEDRRWAQVEPFP
jgi:GT2 family glycosyltransferase